MNLKKARDAVSSVIGLMLILALVLSSLSAIFLVGLPYIESERIKYLNKSVAESFENIDKTLTEIINPETGAQVEKDITIEEGEVRIDDYGDRQVVYYSYTDSFDFEVSGLGLDDTTPNEFDISFDSGNSIDADRAEIYWLNDTCFLAGTKVLMEDYSYKNIEDIKKGQSVKSYDFESGRIVNSKVKKTFFHKPDEMADFYLKINNDLMVTPNHLFFSEGSWVHANDLILGDILFTKDFNSEIYISSIEKIFDKVPTYNLEIENVHNYYVQLDNKFILVHNAQTEYPCIRARKGCDVKEEFDGGTGFNEEELEIINNDVEGKYVNQICNIGLNQYAFHMFTFQISESPEEISIIEINWVGYGSFNSMPEPPRYMHSLYILKDVGFRTTDWIKLDFENFGSTIPDTLTGYLFNGVNDISSYIFDGKIYIGAQSDYRDDMSIRDSRLYSNYVEVKITTSGPVNNPPNPPSNPNPANDETSVAIDTSLSWDCSDPDGDPLTYDVLFKKSDAMFNTAPYPSGDLIADGISKKYCSIPFTLNYNANYYWKVIANDGTETTSGGPWRFTTRLPENIAPEIVLLEPVENYGIYYNQSLLDGYDYYGDAWYSFHAQAIDTKDIYSDEIFYNFSWGDGTFDYIGPYSSGDTTDAVSHRWPNAGVYEITVTVNDTMPGSWDSEFNTSDAYVITVLHTVTIPNDYLDYDTDNPSDGKITANKAIEGLVRIDLYSNSYPPGPGDLGGEVPIGIIWVFDLGSIVYIQTTASGIFNTIYQNRAILQTSADYGYIQEYSNVVESGESLIFRVSQIRANSVKSGSGEGIYKLIVKLDRNLVRESKITKIYNFKLKFYGENSDIWYDYFDLYYEFYETGDDSLVYRNGDGIYLLFSSSVINIDLHSIR